jgi:hypothetical protein
VNAATGRASADFANSDHAHATGFNSEARRVAQLGRFVTAIQLGMTRAEVERLLGNPPVQGGLTPPARPDVRLVDGIPVIGEAAAALSLSEMREIRQLMPPGSRPWLIETKSATSRRERTT